MEKKNTNKNIVSNESNNSMINTILIGVVALCSVIMMIMNITTNISNKAYAKKEAAASYLNTIPAMLDIICDGEDGEYFVPNAEERKAICSYDVQKIFEYNKKAQEDTANQVNSNQTETEANETEQTEQNTTKE